MLMARTILCALTVLVLATPAWASQIITVERSDFLVDFPKTGNSSAPLPASLPIALFDFRNTPQLQSLTRIDLSLSIEDGDTGIGELDQGNLKVALDGVTTGLTLDGFKNGEKLELSFSLQTGDPGFPDGGTVADILNNIYSDNELLVSLVDTTPDGINKINLYSSDQIRLRLHGEDCPTGTVPEPTSVLAWLLGFAAMRALRQRAQRAANAKRDGDV